MSIFKRLVLLVLLAITPLLGVEVYNEFRLREVLSNEIAGASRRLLETVTAQQARLIEGAKAVLASVRFIHGAAHPDFCPHVVDEMAGQLPTFDTLYLLGGDGRVRCASDRRWVGRDFAGRSAEVAEGNAEFPYVISLAPEPAIEFGAYDVLTLIETPVALADGGTGRLGMAIHQGWIRDFVHGKRPRQNVEVSIIGADGAILYSAPAPEHFVGQTVPPEWRALLTPGKGVVVRRLPNMAGVPSVHAVSQLSTDIPGFYVDISIGQKEALAPINAAARRSALLWALAALLTAGAIWLGGERFIRAPVAALVAATRRWREGDRAARVHLQTSTVELKCLGRAFDDMAESLERQDKARQEAIRQAQVLAGKVASILESTADAVIELSCDWRYVFLNTRARQALETGGSLLGKSLWDAFPAPLGSVDQTHLRRAMEAREPAEYESYCAPWQRWFHVRAFPSAEGIAIFFRDVTEDKALEEAARRSQALLSQVLELLPVGVWILDETGRIVRGNPAGHRIWSGSRYVCMERFGEYKGWFADTGRRVAAEEWGGARAIAKGETVLGEVIDIEAFDGSRRTILNSALPVRDGAKRLVGAIVVNEDVTRLRAATQAAERANLAKSKFLAAASHDLRQPVQSLLFLIDVLATSSAGRQAAKVVGNMRRSAEALRSILDGLLDISKLDVGGITPEIADVPLDALLTQMRDEYAPRFAAKGVEFRMVATTAWGRTDPLLLGRMLRNLLENALKYTERGKVLLGCRRRGDRVAVVVGDTGVGIAPDKLIDIWEEFYQVANPNRDRRFGLGLGLAIVRRLAKLLGHRVDARSAAGKGSLFSVELPAAAERKTETSPACLPSPAASRKTLVVIDDDPIVLEGLRAVLEMGGYTVLAATELSGAMDGVRGWTAAPDAMIVDYRLGAGETGIDAVRSLRELFRRSIPAVILTGDTSSELVDAVRGGCCRVMNKPVHAEELKTVIEDLTCPERAAG
ncbi:MAG: PAS domain-containing protein [Magnetospirillum sp.]|nr:PAS domain-containing protein [Magnetospirillum sp.]